MQMWSRGIFIAGESDEYKGKLGKAFGKRWEER